MMNYYSTWLHEPKKAEHHYTETALKWIVIGLFFAIFAGGLFIGLHNAWATVMEKARIDAAWACQIGAECK